MKFISESESTRLISHESAFEAVRKALVAAASADAKVFPAVIAHASDRQNTFSLKSGSTPELAGLKVGSFWPDNPAKGRPRHSSTIVLIDQDNGRIGAGRAGCAGIGRTGTRSGLSRSDQSSGQKPEHVAKS
jgi:ornithine cyclodeaminase